MLKARIHSYFMSGELLCVVVNVLTNNCMAMFMFPVPEDFTLHYTYPRELKERLYDLAYSYEQPERDLLIELYWYIHRSKNHTIWIPDDYNLNYI